jgi:hypothetical protein
LLPDLALPTLREDIVIKPTTPRAVERRVWAAVRAKGARSLATEAMLEVLRETAARFESRVQAAPVAA